MVWHSIDHSEVDKIDDIFRLIPISVIISQSLVVIVGESAGI